MNDYDAIFYVGGHGPVIDLATDPVNIQLASQFWQAGKIVSAVCHGPAALVGATDNAGESIFKGREATCFTNAEEIAVDQVKVRYSSLSSVYLALKHDQSIPFLVEDRITELGGKFVKADALWSVRTTLLSAKLRS